MYEGWLSVGGVEVVNNARTAAYAHSHGFNWLNDCTTCPSIPIVEDGVACYVSPKDDPAPWVVSNRIESFLYLGAYMLSAEGVDDSKKAGTVVNGISSSWVTRSRWAAREMTFRVLLVAVDERGLQFGYELFDSLPDGTCSGSTMEYYAACSCVCTSAEGQYCLDECVKPWKRQFKRTRVIQGMTVLKRYSMPSGGVASEVEMVIAAADPRPYRIEADLALPALVV